MKMKIVSLIRPETRRAMYEQDEVSFTADGGPNPLLLQKFGMTCT